MSTGQQFTARVFLNGETFKNVQLATSASAGDLTELLVEKLNLGDGDSYEMVERRNGKGMLDASVECVITND